MDTQFASKIERAGGGYFGIPEVWQQHQIPSVPEREPWLTWRIILDQAKAGRFDQTPTLAKLYDPSGDYVFNRQCVLLIGDTGNGSAFEPLVRELKEPRLSGDYEVGINFTYALSIRGLLADVPLILDTYQQHAWAKDADIIPVYISRMLEPAPGELIKPERSSDKYPLAVMDAYRHFSDQFGTDQVLMVLGDRYGVVRLAEKILDALQRPYFSGEFRRRFEAATGINCSSFYSDGSLQPLAASATVQKFLESEQASSFEDGIRYFFGHRIPG